MGGMPTDDLGDAQQADPATPNQPSTPSPEATRTLVFDERATAHSPAEDILGILTGTFTASLGLYLLQSSEAVTGGTAEQFALGTVWGAQQSGHGRTP